MHIMIAAALLSVASAGAASAQRVADIKGFHFGAAVNWTTIEADETAVTDDDQDRGPGLNLSAGYNFTRNFGLTLGLTAAGIEDNQTGDYDVGHIDLGARFSFPGSSAFVPYVELALTAMSAEFEVQGQEVELKGGGISAGAGLNYFFSRLLAFDANFRLTGGEFTKVEIDDREVRDVDDIGVTTGRINIGLAIYP
jgi:hypothetical protein